MLSFAAKALTVLVSLQASLGLAVPLGEVDVEKRATGFVNSVYFTNWFVYFSSLLFAIDRLVKGASTVVTINLRIFQLARFLMFSTHS